MGLTDAIARCRAGDRAAYREVVAAHADRLVGLLRRLLGDVEDARDVAQEAFVRAFRNLHRFDTDRPFEPWLYRIARNLAYNHLASKGRRLESRLDRDAHRPLDEIEDSGPSPAAGLLAEERRGGIDVILSSMRPEYREVLILRYQGRLEYDEMAIRIGVPLGTVKTWLNRAKKQFRELAAGKDWL